MPAAMVVTWCGTILPFVYFPQGRTGLACESDVSATGLLTALSRAAPPDFVF
jgi:hypothetical protein